MKACGEKVTKQAFTDAFSKTPRGVFIPEEVLPEIEEQLKDLETVPDFNRMFPEMKKRGRIRGFPFRESKEQQRLWIQAQARKILVGRAKIAAASAGTDTVVEAAEKPVDSDSEPAPAEVERA